MKDALWVRFVAGLSKTGCTRSVGRLAQAKRRATLESGRSTGRHSLQEHSNTSIHAPRAGFGKGFTSD